MSDVNKHLSSSDSPVLQDSPNGCVATITFQNYSDQAFDLIQVDYPTDGYGIVNVPQTPGPVLQAMDGMQTLAFEQTGTWMGHIPIVVDCSWNNPGLCYSFGVQIVIPLQVLGMGPEPHWNIFSSAIGETWQRSGDVPNTQYTWEGLPVSIQATPNSHHSWLSVTVIIQGKNN